MKQIYEFKHTTQFMHWQTLRWKNVAIVIGKYQQQKESRDKRMRNLIKTAIFDRKRDQNRTRQREIMIVSSNHEWITGKWLKIKKM